MMIDDIESLLHWWMKGGVVWLDKNGVQLHYSIKLSLIDTRAHAVAVILYPTLPISPSVHDG